MQTANENIQQSFKSESAPCIKLLKKESTPKKSSFFKRIPVWRQHETLA